MKRIHLFFFFTTQSLRQRNYLLDLQTVGCVDSGLTAAIFHAVNNSFAVENSSDFVPDKEKKKKKIIASKQKCCFFLFL